MVRRTRYARPGRGALAHRFSELRRNKPAVLAGLLLLGAFLVVVAWCAWTSFSVARDLDEVESKGLLLRAELVDGDAAGARRALVAYQDAASSADSATDGPSWWLMEHLPVWGDDAEAVTTAARVLDALGDEALPPLVDAAEEVTAKAFHPEDHVFPLEKIAALKKPAAASETAFVDADEALQGYEPDDFVAVVRERFEDLRDMVEEARGALDSAFRAAELMPAMLGEDGPTDYLLVFQNNAELRSTGGLPGSVSLVHAEDGAVRIVDQRPGAEILPRDPAPITKEEKNVFGEILSTFFIDANLTPHVPRAAALMREGYRQATGVEVDGVILVDPVALSYLLEATGPVEVPGYPEVTAATVVEAVENRIYVQTTDRDAHDDYHEAVAKAVFDVFAGGGGDPADIIRGLARGVEEGRIRMHSFEPEVQEHIAGTAIAGELTEDATRPTVGVYVNDSTQSKMSYYLEYDVDLVARSCAGDVQTLVGTIEITNDTPEDVAALPLSVTGAWKENSPVDPGQQIVLLYLMSPIGGRIEELEFDGRELARPILEEYRGRLVAPLGLYLDPGQSQTIDFTMRTGKRQTGSIDLFVTPNAKPGTESATVRSAC